MGITKEQLADWLTPDEALTVLHPLGKTAKHALLERLMAGFVKSAAFKSKWKKDDVDGELTGPIDIPNFHWEEHKHSAEWETFWTTADMSLTMISREFGYRSTSVVRYADIRFNPEDVKAMLASAPKPRASAAATKPQENKGGRPSKPWWQDFWIEMCRRVYEGDIQPEKTQAEVQRIMEQWVSDHDHDAGPTVMKEAAKKLLLALKSKLRN